MSVNYELRPATPDDATALQQACWPERSVDGVRELLERAEGLAKHRRGLGIVAISDYRVLGYGQLTIWPRTSEISDLIVAADVRGQGIGTAIICDLVDRARMWPMQQVEIGVAMNNPRAHALYRRLGFIENRTIQLDLGTGPEPVTYLVMQLK
jgi:ribosomal protein S18 acetylase RimI-like enzyme